MTPIARKALSATVRALRDRLLRDLAESLESTYRLGLPAERANLPEAARLRRRRLEDALDEQVRAGADRDRVRAAVVERAAYTWLHRLVVLHVLEARPGRKAVPPVVTGGWESRGYRDFRSLAGPAVCADPTDQSEGMSFLLHLVFEDLAVDLPGLFGPQGLADLVPVSPGTLRHLLQALDDPELAPCWTDDLTLGWVYQYWNDPAREALDAKLAAGGKLAPHELASKTQMFTERYMVDWLLQNTLGPLWLAICAKHDWTPDVVADGTLARLEARRADWRAKRASGEVALTDLMPLHTDAERRWAYTLDQPPVPSAVDSVRDLKILDPALGSGHFLVVALDLLVALGREEARHRGVSWSDAELVEHFLASALHGVDLDPRAVQIAAATLWLKATELAPGVQLRRLNLVASDLRLAELPEDDPALVELRGEIERETGIPGGLTDTLVHALRGADQWGSLLRVDQSVRAALRAHERRLQRSPDQPDLFRPAQVPLTIEQARDSVNRRMEAFLAAHTSSHELGLRLRGEQLAAGVRFVRMMQEGQYDLVVANPPYQGTAKMADAGYAQAGAYALGKADLFAAFLLRGLQLAKPGGVSAMLTMRNWMFLKQYAGLREHLLETYDLRALGDFDRGAFEDVPDEVVSVSVSVFGRAVPTGAAVALCPTPREDHSRDGERTPRKRAATLCQEGRHTFEPAALRVVPEWPLVYWWRADFIATMSRLPILDQVAAVRQGLASSDNTRFLVRPWEIAIGWQSRGWAPYVKGASGKAWVEPLDDAIRWSESGLEVKTLAELLYGSYTRTIKNEAFYFRIGVAFSMIGQGFVARVHRYPSVIADKGSSVYGPAVGETVCLMNSAFSKQFIADVNPSVSFQVGDVKRLPYRPVDGAQAIYSALESAFGAHEAHREPSIEFATPGPSPWRQAQEWAQAAVDRPEGAPLPEYVEVLDPEPPTDHLSYALGRALGRFGPVEEALPHGVLFLDRTLAPDDLSDGLGSPAAAPLHAAWASHGPAIGTKRGLRDWLALDFFKDVHKGMYENRPIHWPLSSGDRTFVAWVNIHRMTEQTLRILLADHLVPTLARLEGRLQDLRAARDGADKAAAKQAERALPGVLRARDELARFLADVEQCADRGAPPTDPKCPAREVDARYAPDLDDGVMVNSSALWPLLDPQWKDPKKWWKELATASGRKDYDWSHLAMRYWPTRVDEKVQRDPSLGVAHGAFWRYHPARAWAWELRLQDEIGPEHRIEEAPYRPGGRDLGDPGSGAHRAAYLRDHWEEALAAVEKEGVRRMGRAKSRKVVSEVRLLEAGLWADHPAEVWGLELRLSEKQGSEVRVTAPDEPAARAAYAAAWPLRAMERTAFLAGLTAPTDEADPEVSDPPDADDDPDAD